MSHPNCPTDPAHDVVTEVMKVVRAVFDPDSPCPPVGPGSTNVRFFTWAGAPLAAWDAHTAQKGCDEPFLWVRLDSRFRTDQFPRPVIVEGPCKGLRAITLEIGVARCVSMEAQTDWDQLAREASIGIDDSWRVEHILCTASSILSSEPHNLTTAVDTVVPYGPEGGIAAWSGVLHVGFN